MIQTAEPGATVRRRVPVNRIQEELRERVSRLGQSRIDGSQRRPGDFFERLRFSLCRHARLLRLSGADVVLDKHPIYQAYLHDVGLFGPTIRALVECITAAVRSSVLIEREEASAKTIKDSLARKWQRVARQIPEFAWTPALSLDARRAGQTAAGELLVTLQDELQHDAESFAMALRNHFVSLVEQRFLGCIEWTSDTTCCYGYFRHGAAEDVTDKDRWERREGPYIVERERRTVSRQHFCEHHEHHLFDAQRHTVTAYAKPVPPRVACFLESVTPWLAPCLAIVDGHMLRERIIRWDLEFETDVEEEVIARVRNYSPAVTLGEFVLLGWNGRELDDHARTPDTSDDVSRYLQDS